MQVRIPNLGLSVIGGRAQKRKELIYVNLHEVSYSTETTKDEYIQQVAITYINIDNNYDHFAFYPVMLAPKFPLKYITENKLRHIDVYLRSALNNSDVRMLAFVGPNLLDYHLQFDIGGCDAY